MMKDPFNLIITGVGGQGNVLASQIIGRVLIKKGFQVTIGETYGLSQRGGAVLSHVRISAKESLGPLVPKGRADYIMGLEPVEALRVLGQFGSSNVSALVNSRPVYPMGVIAGETRYPEMDAIKRTLAGMTRTIHWVDATEMAMVLGHPILTNLIMIGALVGVQCLPIYQSDMLTEIEERFPPNKWEMNKKALEQGMASMNP